MSESRPKLLDLFSGAGGAAMGYYRAGFDVTGIDIKHQPRYPFKFIQADALEYVAEHGREFDVIHASPPCQDYSVTKNRNPHRSYPRLIDATRQALEKTGLPFAIENVYGARSTLKGSLILCGSSFGLKVYRHRVFESNVFVPSIYHEPHNDNTPSVGRGFSDKGFISVGNGGIRGMNSAEALDVVSKSMGIDWMNRNELSEAIPPAYTEYIGKYMLAHLQANAERLRESGGETK